MQRRDPLPAMTPPVLVVALKVVIPIGSEGSSVDRTRAQQVVQVIRKVSAASVATAAGPEGDVYETPTESSVYSRGLFDSAAGDEERRIRKRRLVTTQHDPAASVLRG